MRANRKWTVRAVTLVLMALVAAGIVLWDFGNPYDKQKFVEAQETTPPTEASAGEAFELCVWNGSLCIEWWKMSRTTRTICFCRAHLTIKTESDIFGRGRNSAR